MKRDLSYFDPFTGAQLLDSDGYEILDSEPVSFSVGFPEPESLHDRIRRSILSELKGPVDLSDGTPESDFDEDFDYEENRLTHYQLAALPDDELREVLGALRLSPEPHTGHQPLEGSEPPKKGNPPSEIAPSPPSPE